MKDHNLTEIPRTKKLITQMEDYGMEPRILADISPFRDGKGIEKVLDSIEERLKKDYGVLQLFCVVEDGILTMDILRKDKPRCHAVFSLDALFQAYIGSELGIDEIIMKAITKELEDKE